MAGYHDSEKPDEDADDRDKKVLRLLHEGLVLRLNATVVRATSSGEGPEPSGLMAVAGIWPMGRWSLPLA